MRIIALKTLRLFWEQHPDAQQALQAWYRDAERATWNTPADIKMCTTMRVLWAITVWFSIFGAISIV
jgi:mRNA-degrading endonuclease HigB of HigAB toxin-antitoxin module